MAGTHLRLLVILLGLSHLMICLNAVPVTRTESLMHGPQVQEYQVSENTNLVTEEKSWMVQGINGRMDVETNDYPGSGANNRHTPIPKQSGKCVIDC